MIYRILVDGYWHYTYYADGTSRGQLEPGPLRGAGIGLGDVMWVIGLPAPNISNPRARFYFTEQGWDRYGRVLTSVARRRGHVVKVIRRKNPRKSQIVYQDAVQLAILPEKLEPSARAA